MADIECSEDEYDALARGLHEGIAEGQSIALTAKMLRLLAPTATIVRGGVDFRGGRADEPRTEAGRALLADNGPHVVTGDHDLRRRILAIEHEAAFVAYAQGFDDAVGAKVDPQ